MVLAVALHDAAMGTYEFGDERKPKTGTIGLGGNEGVEEMRQQITTIPK